MRKTLTSLVLVAALCGSLSACEGDKGSTGRDITNEAVSAPSSPVEDTLSVTADEGDSLTPAEAYCKDTVRPYVIQSFEDGLMGTEQSTVGDDAVLACIGLDPVRVQELWVDVLREEYGDEAADMVSSAIN